MPARTATQLDYGRRVARAMARIAANPARGATLEELAEAAAFSPYHFHRIYRALTGETPAETLARERLSRAAALLLRDAAPVAAIARRCGYGSAAALTRAFRAAYGVPPAAYRATRGIGAPVSPIPQPREENACMFEVTIQQMPALRLAAIAHRGPYMEISGAFDRLQAWAGARGLFGPQSRFFGLYYDDPASVPAAQLRSDAAMTIGPDVTAEDGVRILELPAERVAVLVFKGPYAELESAYGWLYRDWLPGSGEEPADAPVREEYLNDCRNLPPSEWLTAIMLPLKMRVPA